MATPRPVYAKPMAWSHLKDAFQPSQPTTEPANRRHADEDNLQTLLTKALERMDLHAKPAMTPIPENRLIEEVSEAEDTTKPVNDQMDWQKIGAAIKRPKAPLPKDASLVKRTRDERARARLQPYGEAPRKARKTDSREDTASPEPIEPEDQQTASPFAGFKWPTFPQNQDH